MKVKQETTQFEDKVKVRKKRKSKAVTNEATASEESSEVAIVQAATGCQVGGCYDYIRNYNTTSKHLNLKYHVLL